MMGHGLSVGLLSGEVVDHYIKYNIFERKKVLAR